MGLSRRTGLSRTTLWRRFLPFFNFRIMAEKINSLFAADARFASKKWVLGIDGKWLHRFGVIMIYRDVTNKINLFWSWQKSESVQNLSDDFYKLKLLVKNDSPSGVVSDWKGGLVTLVTAFFPKIPHQRCLAHVVREARRLLPARTPYPFTWELRQIALEIMHISNPSDLYDWVNKIAEWQHGWGFILKTKTRGIDTKKKWWYTHGNLRRAIRLLTRDQESMFRYLHYPILPKTNNSLEGVNSQLKGKLGDHRGMKPEQQISFVFWWLAFGRVKKPADLRRLWGSLNRG